MIITTTTSVESRAVQEHCRLVMGETIIVVKLG